MASRRWTEEEDLILKNNHDIVSVKDLCSLLTNRSEKAIRSRMHLLDLEIKKVRDLSKKDNIKKAQEAILKNNRLGEKITVLDFKRENRRRFLKCRCEVCKNIWWVDYNNIVTNKTSCNTCMNIKQYTQEGVVDIFKSYGLNLVSNYVSNSSDLICFDKYGYYYRTTLANLRKSGVNICTKFANHNPFSIDNLKNYIINNKCDFELVSEEYIDAKTKLKFRCLIHNEIFEMNTNKLQMGQGCPICGDGYYNIHNAKKNKKTWEQIKSMVYIIRVFNDCEEFYKIGIAKNGLSGRFNKRNMPYNYEILKEIKNINQFEACFIESYLKNINKNNRYTPKISFRGETECFKVIPDFMFKYERDIFLEKSFEYYKKK